MALQQIERYMRENKSSAIRGMRLFKKLRKGIPYDTYVLIFPDGQDEVNFYGLLYLDEFLLRRGKKDALIITSSEIVKKSAYLFSEDIRRIDYLSEDEIDGIIDLYNTVNFADICFVSLTKPEGRMGDALVGVNGITVEMAVAVGVYFLIPFRQIKKRPDYDGGDDEIKAFLDIV